ncbi:FAD-binding monooxygenase [Chromobacterium sinusclupearum]|uniref:FAD-binding monooxygenase n=1 Tax=Chromobacterium sinusclupearum TaxID=2077146 RepID=A0A2K4MQS1_9NEIS|nr:NAD(P)/FAD-dependent oxidoreductase [Chromobacterium sinusclupearum]POA99407.1 FAD-binding monooxygenase [Chromobacterium sinusclupearum]
MSAKRYDALIAGAGPAGCAVALALQRLGVETLLADRPLAQPFRIGESATPDVAGLLQRLDMRIDFAGHSPYHGNLALWGSDQPQLDHFLFRGRGHGWHLDRSAFDRMLQQEAMARGVAFLGQSGVDGVAPDEGGWKVQVRGIGEVRARVLVDAGGRRSPLAARLGVARHRLDRLQALACHVETAGDLSGYSLVESSPHGWWYATALPDGRALLALMTDQDLAREQRLDHAGNFLAAWRATRLLAERLPPPLQASSLHAFAAHSGCVARAAGPNWICVGDALMGLDPLTSSGISGALSDALAAAPAIVGMLNGNLNAARHYAQRADDSFRRYLAERRQHYGLETRWTELPFWQRRCPPPLGGSRHAAPRAYQGRLA